MTTSGMVTFYRLLVVMLLGVALALGIALKTSLGERGHPNLSMSGTGTGKPARDHVAVVDLRTRVATIDSLDAETGDGLWWLFRSEFGGISLRALGYDQRLPFHLRRHTEEATLLVSGEIEETHARLSAGKVARDVQRPAIGTLVDSPPYTAHGARNLSSSHSALLLSFVSVPNDRERDGMLFLDADDPRVRWGRAPVIVDPTQEIAALKAKQGASSEKTLPMLDGRLEQVTVLSETTIAARPEQSIVYVALGSGTLDAEGKRAIGASELVFVPAGIAMHFSAQADAPLALYVFRPTHLDVSDIVRHQKKLYSQQDEELIIRDFFKDKKDGVFVDVGASHYKNLSTTFYLEEKLGWSGIAIDALAEYGADYAKFRKKTRFMNYLVTDKARGAQKFYRGAVQEVSSAERRFTKDQQRGSEQMTELQIPSITLTELLDQEKVTKVDFLSMDIEGHEPSALAGFAIERFEPDLVCIEAKRSTRDAIFDYFTRHGYERLEKYQPYDSVNWYFAPRSGNLPH